MEPYANPGVGSGARALADCLKLRRVVRKKHHEGGPVKKTMAVLLLVTATLLAVFARAHGGNDDVMTGLELYEKCKGSDVRYCEGYLLGYADGLALLITTDNRSVSCHGSDKAFRLGYLSWAEKNASSLDASSRETAMSTLVKEGFCVVGTRKVKQ